MTKGTSSSVNGCIRMLCDLSSYELLGNATTHCAAQHDGTRIAENQLMLSGEEPFGERRTFMLNSVVSWPQGFLDVGLGYGHLFNRVNSAEHVR